MTLEIYTAADFVLVADLTPDEAAGTHAFVAGFAGALNELKRYGFAPSNLPDRFAVQINGRDLAPYEVEGLPLLAPITGDGISDVYTRLGTEGAFNAGLYAAVNLSALHGSGVDWSVVYQHLLKTCPRPVPAEVAA